MGYQKIDFKKLLGAVPLLILDDGHGLETPGKRTPTFPDGTVIKENEFNSPVTLKAKRIAEEIGIEVFLTSPETTDTPLSTRTLRANNKLREWIAKNKNIPINKASASVSVHYNAFRGKWDETKGGIETLYQLRRNDSRELAKAVHKSVIQGTPMPDRGIKETDLHMTREIIKCPAILVELGFMDVMAQAKLMKSEAYQTECAEEIVAGVLEFWGFRLRKIEDEPGKIKFDLDGRIINLTGFLKDGKSYVWIRELLEALGYKVDWSNNTVIARRDLK